MICPGYTRIVDTENATNFELVLQKHDADHQTTMPKLQVVLLSQKRTILRIYSISLRLLSISGSGPTQLDGDTPSKSCPRFEYWVLP